MTVSRTVLVAAGTLGLCMLSYFAGAAQAREQVASASPQPLRVSESARPAERDRTETTQKARDDDPAAAPSLPPACPKPLPTARLHPSETIVAAADALPDLLREWDRGVAESLFDEDVDLDAIEAQLAWMRDKVGQCGAAAPMNSGTESSARFVFVCERGVVEAQFAASDPDAATVAQVRTGVRDAQPPQAVSEAGGRFTDLIETWNPDTFQSTFSENFREKLGEGMPDFAERLRDKLGTCEVGPVDLAGANSALFVLDCENGRRTMTVKLDDEQRISGLRVVPLRRDPRP